MLDLNRQCVFKYNFFEFFDQNKGDTQRIIDIHLKQSSDPPFVKIKTEFQGAL